MRNTNNDKEPGKANVRSVQLAFDVLERVAAAHGDIGVSELAAQLGVTKASVFRHLQTLVERGYLSQDPNTSRYRLGVQSYVLGQMAAGGCDLVDAASDGMRDLQRDTGLSTVLATLQGKRLIVVNTQIGRAPLEIGVRSGTELAMHCHASGKIALAFSSRLGVEQLDEHLPSLTPHTVTNLRALSKAVEQTRREGWAAAIEEETLGISALAAPILGNSGDLVAVICLVASVQHINHVPNTQHIEALKRAALRISWNLGYSKDHLVSLKSGALAPA
ncbi:IclR family transcriptional regulator [Pseudomonas sp. NMI542_15]|uniref:IclR family transcriptional regulator n=1 Tax=Pseudomonas sp. NMI542_15 TaxID=2903148 RepID=UPI001E2FC90A|nr:IclR family transcriptional regulator [Pseudomonas sp. NMI542_15]MCE0777559.1 IclR family transcriptional regulator [Pseudomonas sp. NMI542_15]